MDNIWNTLRTEAEHSYNKEPLLQLLVKEAVIDRDNFSDALISFLARILSCELLPFTSLYSLLYSLHQSDSTCVEQALFDLAAIVERDPASKGYLNPFLNYKGFHALQMYRFAHLLYRQERFESAYLIQSIVSRRLSVDIHPAAVIGHGILIDHATGVVIGETARVGNNVSILHEVTLGGTGKELGDRHPKVGDGVLIGAGAKLLGNITIGDGAKIGAGSVVLKDVPAHTTVVGVPAQIVGHPECDSPSLEMNQNIE